MKILKYPKRISKETNTGFAIIWAVAIVCFITDNKPDWRVLAITTFLILLSYCFLIWLIKKIVWDRDIKNIQYK